MYESYAIMRDKAGMKDADVAKATGISRSTFSEWKSGRSEPKLDKLYKIARALNCRVDSFFSDFTPDAMKRQQEIERQKQEETSFELSDDELLLLIGYRAASVERKEDMLEMARKALKRQEEQKSSVSKREEIA